MFICSTCAATANPRARRRWRKAPDANPPIVRTATAVKDIAAVVDFILKRRNIPRLVLLGWSWGTFSSPTYAIANPGKVERLVLYAPIWIGMTGRLAMAEVRPDSRLPHRHPRSRDVRAGPTACPKTRRRRSSRPACSTPGRTRPGLPIPEGAKMNPPVIRAPNGVMADVAETWWVGKPYYDPAKITAPVLLVTAAWDNDVPPQMARTLFPLLVNSPGKRLVELAQGTHSVMMERSRFALFEAVQTFLDEGGE